VAFGKKDKRRCWIVIRPKDFASSRELPNLVVDTTNMKPAGLDQNIIFLCAEFSHRFSQVLAAEFKQHNIDITAEQFSILVVLWYKEGISQKEISEKLNRDKTTVTRVLMNMKKNKLIRQVTDTADNRSNLIYLTTKGKEIQKAGVKVSGELYLKVLKAIPQAQLLTSINVLQKMTQSL
jgi:DNA-binding MarR family transcriptional regulator